MHIFSQTPPPPPPKEKGYLPTYPPFLSMGRPTANKDIFKPGLKLTDCQYLEFI